MNYYRVDLLGGRELFIQNDLLETTEKFIEQLDKKFLGSGFVALRQANTSRERNPVHFSKSAILSIEKVNQAMVGVNNKKWELVK